MAKKKAAAKEVERKVLSNGVILIKYDDGSYAFLTPISAEDAEEIFGGESETPTKTKMKTPTKTKMKTPTKTKMTK